MRYILEIASCYCYADKFSQSKWNEVQTSFSVFLGLLMTTESRVDESDQIARTTIAFSWFWLDLFPVDSHCTFVKFFEIIMFQKKLSDSLNSRVERSCIKKYRLWSLPYLSLFTFFNVGEGGFVAKLFIHPRKIRLSACRTYRSAHS